MPCPKSNFLEEDNQKKTDTTGNLFQNPIEKKRPVNLTSEEVMGECSVGSPVEVHLNGIKTDIVRWIGYVKDPSCLIAGLEMVIIMLLQSFVFCRTTQPTFKQIHNCYFKVFQFYTG